jgi:hypothetical protein
VSGPSKRISKLDERAETEEAVIGSAAPRPAPRATSVAGPTLQRPPTQPTDLDAGMVRERMKSDAEFDFNGTVSGMVEHTKRLEEALGRVAGVQETQSGNDDVQNAALLIIARELGIESKLPPALQNSLPPPALKYPPAPPPPPVLGRLERRAKTSQIVQLVIALSVIADLVKSIFFPHH